MFYGPWWNNRLDETIVSEYKFMEHIKFTGWFIHAYVPALYYVYNIMCMVII